MEKISILLLFFLLSCATTKSTYTTSIPAEVLKLCFIGDTGTGDERQLAVSNLLEKEKCHSIHFLGDIIYRRGLKDHHDKQFQKKFWNFYKKVTLKDHKLKLYMTMGNHDHHGSIEAWRRLAEKHPQIFFPYPYYLLKQNDVCMVHLATDYYRPLSNYLMTFGQLNWVQSLNKELKSCKTKIALGHHPYDSSGIDHGNSYGLMRYQLRRTILGKYDYYIAGHDHILADEGRIKGTRLLISGAGGQADEGHQNGFLVMEISQKGVNYEFRKVPLAK